MKRYDAESTGRSFGRAERPDPKHPAPADVEQGQSEVEAALLTNPDGSAPRFDVLRPQRLAAPVTVYVEQFSAHPLEADAAELKARLLLMACLMKFGALPPAVDPDRPTAEEAAATYKKVAEYQAIFNTH